MSDDFDKEFSWLDNDDEETPGGEPDDELAFDWQQDDESADQSRPQQGHLGVTGELSWLRDTGDQGKKSPRETSDFPAMDWQKGDADTPRPDETRTGVTGELSWIEGVHDRFEQQVEEAEEAARSESRDEIFDLLDKTEAPTVPARPAGLQDRLSAVSAEMPSFVEDEAGDSGSLGDLPPWMQGMAADDEELAEEETIEEMGSPFSPFEEELPSWLQGQEDETAFEEEPAEEAPPPWMSGSIFSDEPQKGGKPQPISDLPPWMAGMGFDDEVQEEAQPADEGLPAWTMDTAEPGDEDLPPWMVESGADDAEPEEESFAEEASGAGGEEVPPWMTDSGFADEEEPAGEEPPRPARPGVPDWLRTGAYPQVDAYLKQEREEPEAETPVQGIPDWLRTGAHAQVTPEQPTFESELEKMDAELPDFDSMFAAPSAAEPPEFDLLSELSAGAGDLDALLASSGGGEFDLLGELAGGDELDLPGKMAGEPLSDEEEPFAEMDFGAVTEEEAAAEAPDFETLFAEEAPEPAGTGDFDERFDEEEFEAGFEQAAGLEPAEIDVESLFDLSRAVEEEAEAAPASIDDDFASLFGTDEDEDEIDKTLEGFDWFKEEAPTTAAVPASSEDLSWLEQLEAAGQDVEEQPTAAAQPLPEPAALPAEDDFLADLMPPEAEPVVDEDVLEDFLASLDEKSLSLPDTGELALGLDKDFDELFDEAALPDVRKGAKGPAVPVELAPDAPEWLAEASRAAAAEVSSAAASLRQKKDRPLDELSDRLKELRERGFEISSEPYARGNTGMLSSVLPGVHNTLPAVSFGDTSTLAADYVVRPLELTPEQQAHVDLLRKLTGSTAALGDLSKAEEVPAVRRLWVRSILSTRFVVSVLLAVLMILPFFGVLHIGDLPPAQFAGGTRQAAFVDQVNRLQLGDLILIATEYGPTGAAELDDATETLLLHSLSQGARPVIVSGDPAGLLHAGNIMRAVAETNHLQENRDYFIGQYLVGDAIGLRTFGENINRYTKININGDETGLDIHSLDEFALMVIVVERSDRLQAWAEQIAPITRTPLMAITGFAASPLSQPYLDAHSEDVAGLLVGYTDAYTYRRMFNIMIGVELPPTETPAPTDTPETPEVTPVPVEAGTEEATSEVAPEQTEAVEATPTDTPEPPTSTPTNTPTFTPTNTPTQTPTATPTFTPSPTHTPEPVRYAVVTADGRVNVRDGDSTSNAAVGTLGPRERALIIGENADASWFNVILEDGTEGWVAAFVVEVEIVQWDGTRITPTPVGEAQSAKWDAVPPLLKNIHMGTQRHRDTGKRNHIGIGARNAQSLRLVKYQQPPIPITPQGTQEGGGLPFSLQPPADGTQTPGLPNLPALFQTAAPGFTPEIDLSATFFFPLQALTTTPEATDAPSTPALSPEPATPAAPDESSVTQEAVPAQSLPAITPTPQPTLDVSLFANRTIVVPEQDGSAYRDERWYSMTIGILMAAAIIAVGNVLNILRGFRRRRGR